MEFVGNQEVQDLLEEFGVEEVQDDDQRIFLEMQDADGVVHYHLTCPDAAAIDPFSGAKIVPMPKDKLGGAVDRVIHNLNLSQVLAMPVTKWRKVFDTVAFSMAGNEHWQEMDAAATVELNTRDPLLFEPADFPTLVALVTSLMKDADHPDQGLMLMAAGTPVVIELVPTGAIRMSFGTQVLADEATSAFAH
ncbi:MAG TPA: hypothetical protein VG711_09125 [Phycisphaerales bacterium]|nr:hypothetical protein [Phycisphaerales bacterium]